MACDCDTDLPNWLEDGCPTGVACPIEPQGVFPSVNCPASAAGELEDLYNKAGACRNYASLYEHRAEVLGEMNRLMQRGYVTRCDSWQEVVERFGNPVVSKMAAVVKDKPDGTRKVRLIIGMLRSGVNRHVKLQERVVLPRLCDAVSDIQALAASTCKPSEELDQMVIDFEDAFHSLGVRREEMPFQVVKGFDQEYYVYETVVFGGGGSPLAWGRAAAFLGRSGQALFQEDEARLEIFVDDPWSVWRGCVDTRRRNKAILLLWWLALGLRLSWKKMSVGRILIWIGASLAVAPDRVVVAIPERYAEAVSAEAAELLGLRAIPARRLRKLAGKTAWAGSIVPYLSAMVAPLWAALADVSEASDSQTARAPTVRVAHALRWLLAFFTRRRGTTERSFPFSVDSNLLQVKMVFDGSPWGYGGILYVGGKVVSCFADAISAEDVSHFGIQVGSSKHQALIELIAILIGVRTWRPWAQEGRCVLEVSSDSSAALGACLRMRSPCAAMNTVVRELALDLAEGQYHVDIFSHLPGQQNAWADALSRMHQPGVASGFPGDLASVPRETVAKRSDAWWEAAGDPTPRALF
eukprot:TRINITY_DN93326_c0_g1_i1.p2 TRINITY_DN93326_c0_g1~~TRINITY_DN93326_c0_g1_i1.p2  ORF type:complete len:624 (-),score=62.32 TRINITY_DN93326_c0_g1_i1:111-1853(-)